MTRDEAPTPSARRWRLHEDIAWTEAGEERVAVLAFAVGRPVVLEGSAAAIAERTDRAEADFSAEDLAAPLAAEHGVALDRMTEDVLRFLETLHAEGLLTTAH